MKKVISMLAIISMITPFGAASGCPVPKSQGARIELNRFSDSNYDVLNKNLSQKVCIVGALSINSMGVYYALQPSEGEDGAIDLAVSRVSTGLNRVHASKIGLKDGRNSTICGRLEDTTPFKGCVDNYCKWYTLTNAEPLKKRQEK